MRSQARRLPERDRPKPKPSRKRPIPRAAARRVGSPQPPHAVEMYMVTAMTRVAKTFAKAVRKHLTPKVIERFANANVKKKRADADLEDLLDEAEDEDLDEDAILELLDEIETLIAKIHDEVEEMHDADELAANAEQAGKRAQLHSKNEFDRLGIKVAKEPDTKWLVRGFQKDIAERTTGLQADQVGKLENILTESYGRRAENIAKDITNQLDGVSLSRAEFIARDAVLTLNSKITAERQTAAGIERYIWTTSNDERVRIEHQALEGTELTWESGGDPEEGHPGEAPNCRCTAFPILPELEDDDEEAN
jgi:SPP1 gp7 family putative phage head morphogenesis protein